MLRKSWYFENDISTCLDSCLDSLNYPKLSIFVEILIKTLNLNIWKSSSRHVKKVSTLWKWHFNMLMLVSTVSITLNSQFLLRSLLDSWSWHLKKLVSTCWESLDTLKMTFQHVEVSLNVSITLNSRFLLRSWSRLSISTFEKNFSQHVEKASTHF